jgi:hypothetical protein
MKRSITAARGMAEKDQVWSIIFANRPFSGRSRRSLVPKWLSLLMLIHQQSATREQRRDDSVPGQSEPTQQYAKRGRARTIPYSRTNPSYCNGRILFVPLCADGETGPYPRMIRQRSVRERRRCLAPQVRRTFSSPLASIESSPDLLTHRLPMASSSATKLCQSGGMPAGARTRCLFCRFGG